MKRWPMRPGGGGHIHIWSYPRIICFIVSTLQSRVIHWVRENTVCGWRHLSKSLTTVNPRPQSNREKVGVETNSNILTVNHVLVPRLPRYGPCGTSNQGDFQTRVEIPPFSSFSYLWCTRILSIWDCLYTLLYILARAGEGGGDY
jgi:hypothetical protein